MKHLLGSPVFLGSWPNRKILDLAGKACQGQKLPVLFCLGVKSVITVVPDVSRIGANVLHLFPLDPKDLVAMLENFFLTVRTNKLECLSPTSLSSLV